MNKNEKKQMGISDRVSYFYIKNVKKWMFCPACKNGKMTFNKKNMLWTCEDCSYHFSEEYFWMIAYFGFVMSATLISIIKKVLTAMLVDIFAKNAATKMIPL